MTPAYPLIADELLKALEEFDARIGPQGLYASEEHDPGSTRQKWRLEWDQCLLPRLQSLGATASSPFRYNSRMNKRPGTAMVGFAIPLQAFIKVDMVKISKIKVRVYGDSHRVDPHLDFSERWEECQLASYLKRYKPAEAIFTSMLLLVGFDAHREPLKKELQQLRQDRDWEHLAGPCTHAPGQIPITAGFIPWPPSGFRHNLTTTHHDLFSLHQR